MDFLKTFTTVWEPDRMAKIRNCQSDEEKQHVWNEVFKLHKNLESLNSIISKFTAFKREDRFPTAISTVVNLEKYINSLDQKQVELFNASFLKKLQPVDNIDNVYECEIIENEETTSKIENITHEKTKITKQKPQKRAKLIKPAPKKLNLIEKPRLHRHQYQQRDKSEIIQSDGSLRETSRKNNQNTILLISSIGAIVAIIIIIALLSSGESDLHYKLDRITESKPIENTYSTARGKTSHTPYVEDNEKKSTKVDKNKAINRDLQEERKLRENQSKFASLKRNLKLFGGDFEEIIQLQNSSLGKDSVRINLIDHWLAFLEKLNEFKKHVDNFDHIIESETDIQPDVK
ncbi:MAG: hypothetical protein KAR20_28865, partial [Candidatus Heimdallarchaeota archaeon]|nr:hypothetical protein [Candidatus Heimdallarchaeota archaeon]